MKTNSNYYYKSLCVVDAFKRMWNVHNNHQKYEKTAIVWNVCMSEDDGKYHENKNKTNEEMPQMADEQLYVILTVTEIIITYFGHMIRRNKI